MGWAARARERKGNPKTERAMRQVVPSTPLGLGKGKKWRLVKVSDRTYAVDAKGCIRRVPASVLADVERRKATQPAEGT